MGLFLSKIKTLFDDWSCCEARILMLGLDGAGKTTLLYKVQLDETVSIIPEPRSITETLRSINGISFTVWDVRGQEKVRPLWRHYYQNAEGLIFVVDSSDRSRIDEAREELFGILESDEMRGVPVVVLANKQDLPNSLSTSDIVKGLCLQIFTDRKWHIQATSAINGEGIYEGMQQLANMVREYRRDITTA